jgi:hypothetical protein
VKTAPNAHGPFSIVNAPRPLAEHGNLHGKGQRSLFVQFRPGAQLKYSEKITLETEFGNASVFLVGQGVEPVLEMNPEDGKVDLGQVLAGDSSTKTITLKNLSVFPLTYNIISRGNVPTNYNGTSVFSCVPESAIIQPGATQEVQVTVRPDHELAMPFKSLMVVRVPTADEKKAVEKNLYLTAQCWQRQLFARPLKAADFLPVGSRETIDDIFGVPPELNVELKLPEGQEELATKAKSHAIKLVFPKSKNGTTIEKEIAIGATGINEPGRSGNGGSFEIGAPNSTEGAQYFSFEPNKGSLSAGGETVVKVKFTPPAQVDESEQDKEDPCVVIGRWNELTFPCVLKGGYIPNGVGAEETVSITVSGFVVGN